ncbi:PREDICTED: uncharacterized protein LOC105568544, partial [Vollenhovia emeryi]|uniref:uncharacterized protein LOC105568544 n=1 Tax=Vollenhovia emeryi TaxID=411798 RepID=UPI0005F36DAE
MTKESASEMEILYTNIMEIYRTLETLQRPVASWDDFLVFIAVQRLDSDSVKAWEYHLGPSKDPPTWQQFTEFLMTRLLSLQAFEKSRGTKGPAQPRQIPVKAHFQGKLKDQPAFNSKTCGICSENHHPSKCSQYESKTVPQRIALIVKHKLCYNCLGPHRAATYKITRRCIKCGNKHHTTIHKSDMKPKVNKPDALNSENHSDSATKPVQSNVLHSALGVQFSPSEVLLATARVNLLNDRGEKRKVRVLIDQGSEISLIRERVVQLMRIPRKMTAISLVGVGGEQTNKTKGLTSFTLQSLHDSQSTCSVTAHILPKLTTPLPSAKITTTVWPHLAELELADPEFSLPGAIDIIIGSDFYGHIIQDGLVKGVINLPTAQRTIFGWIISGPCGFQPNPNLSSSAPCGLQPTPVVSQSYHVSVDRELLEVLSRFWELEDIPCSSRSLLSTEHQACEDHFQSTHSRDENGRYVVRLPFKDSVSQLGNSKIKAFRLISRMKNTFENDPAYKRTYFDFMNEYNQLQHMRIVSDQKYDPPQVYYLPHHGVKRETSLTTKLRVVFNGSSRTTSGLSLNDILHTGEKLQTDLFNVLIWMRKFLYVFSTDVEKMYRQIKVHSDDWNFQRVLWFDQSDNIAAFQLTTVTYGLACAPFLALRTLLQLVKDHGDQYPLAVPSLTKGRYVDDIFGGADSIQQAQEIVTQLNNLCMAGGFPLQKWFCSHPDILAFVQNDKKILSSSVAIKDNTMLEWDDPLPPPLSAEWINFLQDLQEISSLTFPRWLGCTSDTKLEIHGFVMHLSELWQQSYTCEQHLLMEIQRSP